MKKQFVARSKTVLKAMKCDIPYFYFRSNVYRSKDAIACEKDLSSLHPIEETLKQAGVDIVSITAEQILPNCKTQQALTYSDEERRLKAVSYLDKGYHGVAVVEGTEVFGDIWYTFSGDHNGRVVHPDLKWLRMKCGYNDAYAFDMVLRPVKRGRNLANLLQSGALHEIRKRGYSRALGYYWADNIPALWVHRTLQWKEVKRLKVTRFFRLHYSRES